jgi:hypothetical protein
MNTKTKRVIGIFAILTAVGITAWALARKAKAAPTPPPPPPPPSGYANLYGVVTDAAGAPLAGVLINVGGFEGAFATSVNPSDSAGNYLITDCGITGSGIMLPGTYPVIFTKSGYQSVGATVDLVAGQNTLLNVQLAPITQLEISIGGGALIGVNDQPFSEVGSVPEDLTYPNGQTTVQQYTRFGKLANPIVMANVAPITLNLIDRTFKTSGGSYEVWRVVFLPNSAEAYDIWAAGGAVAGSVSVPSELPARLNLKITSGNPYVPSLPGQSGITYDLYLVLRGTYDGHPAGETVILLRNLVYCP